MLCKILKMSFADKYFQRVKIFKEFLLTDNQRDIDIFIVIPVYNEPDFIKILNSIYNNVFVDFKVEIIAVLNYPENSSKEIVKQTQATLNEVNTFVNNIQNNNLFLSVIEAYNLPKKYAGAGLARKIGMDSALYRFNLQQKSNGIILSLDADTLTQVNYLQSIREYFIANPKIEAANINFAHQVQGKEFSAEIYKAITIYELYLRYYVQALRYVGFSYSFHTIGSAFAVKADVYAKHGGMVLNQSGEDFYFLQKIIPNGYFGEINTTTVFPSSRITDRVIFGTGVAVNQIINKYNFDYPTYTLKSFENLGQFFSQIPHLHKHDFEIEKLDIDASLTEFLQVNKIGQVLTEIRRNTKTENSFVKRFYRWFNSFKIIKYLNFYHTKFETKNSVIIECFEMIKKYNYKDNIDAGKMLDFLRKMQS